MRHRSALLTVYLSILTAFLILVLASNIYIFPEILYALFALVVDPSSQWEYWRNVAAIFTNLSKNGQNESLVEKIILIFAYIVLQGVLLWGLGTIRIDSLARVRWRTVCSFISLSAIAVLLT